MILGAAAGFFEESCPAFLKIRSWFRLFVSIFLLLGRVPSTALGMTSNKKDFHCYPG
jgi:hypothetical protein